MEKIKIAIYRSTSIGDVVLATATLTYLMSLNIPLEISWLGRQPMLELIRQTYPGIKLLEVNRGSNNSDMSKVVDAIAKYHLFLDLQGSLRSKALAAKLMSRGVKTIRMNKLQMRRVMLITKSRLRGRKKPLPDYYLTSQSPQYARGVETLISGLLNFLPRHVMERVSAANAKPFIKVDSELYRQKPWYKELSFGTWLAVAPGAAHPTKQAPREVFSSILQQLADRYSQSQAPGLIFIGDQSDREVALKLLDDIAWPGPILNLAGKLSLDESVAALSKSATCLSNDSGLAHLAEAVGTSVGMMFGPTVEAFGFKPWRPESINFSVKLGCRPCSKHGKIPCRYGDKMCFTSIPTGEVADYLHGQLSKAKP
jgi:ADP-heptose:LPS heptosyltransferase